MGVYVSATATLMVGIDPKWCHRLLAIPRGFQVWCFSLKWGCDSVCSLPRVSSNATWISEDRYFSPKVDLLTHAAEAIGEPHHCLPLNLKKL